MGKYIGIRLVHSLVILAIVIVLVFIIARLIPGDAIMAAMAGSVDLLQRCFTGLETRNDRLVLGPHWPEALGPIEFPFVYRGHRLHLRISGRTGDLTSEAGNTGPIMVECRGRVQHLLPGHTIEVA